MKEKQERDYYDYTPIKGDEKHIYFYKSNPVTKYPKNFMFKLKIV